MLHPDFLIFRGSNGPPSPSIPQPTVRQVIDSRTPARTLRQSSDDLPCVTLLARDDEPPPPLRFKFECRRPLHTQKTSPAPERLPLRWLGEESPNNASSSPNRARYGRPGHLLLWSPCEDTRIERCQRMCGASRRCRLQSVYGGVERSLSAYIRRIPVEHKVRQDRMGGVHPDFYPSDRAVRHFILACRQSASIGLC